MLRIKKSAVSQSLYTFGQFVHKIFTEHLKLRSHDIGFTVKSQNVNVVCVTATTKKSTVRFLLLSLYGHYRQVVDRRITEVM